MIVFQALGESLSLGDIKLPAALLMMIFGSPNSSTHVSTAVLIAAGSRTSAATASTCKKQPLY